MRIYPPILLVSVLGFVPAPAHAGRDFKFGGVGGSAVSGELGFSPAPKVIYRTALGSSFEIGAAFAFDLGQYSPTLAALPGLLLSSPMRVSLANGEKLSASLNLEPGLLMQFNSGGTAVGFQFGVGTNIGLRVNDQLTLGGGVEVPFGMVFGGGLALYVPILVGPVLELAVAQRLNLFFDAKFGPFILASDAGDGVFFGFKLGAGLAYKL